MCNIAGYVGSERAAPILLDMMKAQEGFLGGFYTGIATIHEGKIYYAKLTGDVCRLIEETNAAELPGSIGIIHSRSKSGGGDEWAHPFVGMKNGEAMTAYVANGAIGCFAPRKAELNRVAETLYATGYTFPSAVELDDDKYQRLPNGKAIHMSDTMCQLILHHMELGKDIPNAMTDSFCEMPSEIVGLLLSLSAPESIFWSRINMPMFVGFASHGAYLSSTPMAFPEDVKDYQLLPPCASGEVTAKNFFVKPYEAAPARVAPLTAHLRNAVLDKVQEMITENPMTMSEILKPIKVLMKENGAWDATPAAALVYEILDDWDRQGRLRMEKRTIDGVFEGFTAPKLYISL